MGCKYVNNFEFPAAFGYTGSSPGTQIVRGYKRGGLVTDTASNQKLRANGPARTPPSQKTHDRVAVRSKFAAPSRKPEGTGKGNINREATWTDFKKGGAVPGTRSEKPSMLPGNTKKMAQGGLARGTSKRKMAAIHAKGHKPKMPKISTLAPAGALTAGSPMGAAPALSPPPMSAPGASPAMGMKRGGRC